MHTTNALRIATSFISEYDFRFLAYFWKVFLPLFFLLSKLNFVCWKNKRYFSTLECLSWIYLLPLLCFWNSPTPPLSYQHVTAFPLNFMFSITHNLPSLITQPGWMEIKRELEANVPSFSVHSMCFLVWYQLLKNSKKLNCDSFPRRTGFCLRGFLEKWKPLLSSRPQSAKAAQ